jgi:hypothetical protein
MDQSAKKWRMECVSFAGATVALILLFGAALDQAIAASPNNYCRVTPVRSDALDNPSKHAWDLFLTLVHPAVDMKFGRGVPDCTKPVGAPGTTSVWETWRLARTEVFLSDGSEPPEWNDTSLPHEYLGSVPEGPPSPHDPPNVKMSAEFAQIESTTTGQHILLDPAQNQGVFKDHGGIGETHMNRSTYEFLKQNCLWSFDGLSRYAKAVLDGKKPPLAFPTESIEVKAVWVQFTADDLKSNRQLKYYTGKDDSGNTYGLTALHILTKDVPNWFWATFHHIEEPDNSANEVADTYGRPKELDSTVWGNYELGGTQTDFVSSTGQPTVLSDYYIEFGFTRSSCITCHANAHANPEPERTPDGKLARDDKGRIIAATDGPQQTGDIGLPRPDLFNKNDVPFFAQSDFLWSIPFRAREETKSPPDRCLF